MKNKLYLKNYLKYDVEFLHAVDIHRLIYISHSIPI